LGTVKDLISIISPNGNLATQRMDKKIGDKDLRHHLRNGNFVDMKKKYSLFSAANFRVILKKSALCAVKICQLKFR
jgi:hypothetical protein